MTQLALFAAPVVEPVAVVEPEPVIEPVVEPAPAVEPVDGTWQRIGRWFAGDTDDEPHDLADARKSRALAATVEAVAMAHRRRVDLACGRVRA